MGISRSDEPYTSYIVGKVGGGTSSPYQWNVSYQGGYLDGVVSSDTLAQNYVIVESPVSLNQWFHFVLIFDGSQPVQQRVKLYVNGSSGSSFIATSMGNLGTSTTASQESIDVGATLVPNSLHWSDFLNGDVDDIRIYNRALSAAEVMDLYLAPN